MKPIVIGTRAIACIMLSAALYAAPSQAQVVLNELHYHPASPNGNAEFVELHNDGVTPVDISGWTVSGFAVNSFTFPGGTSLAADGYVVVANDAALLQSLTGFLTPYQWATGNLSNAGETVTLTDDLLAEIDAVSYEDTPPWDSGADGSGPSLERVNPAFDGSSPQAWGASLAANGTPGAQNSSFSENPIVLAESPTRLSIVGALPTVSVTFAESVQNVAAGDLSVNGSAATAVTGSAAGPYEFSGFAAPTTAPISVTLAAGAIEDLDTNAFAGTDWIYPNVVINELHYHPADPNGTAEFIELLNAGSIPVDVSGWLLDFGPVPFQFPAATSVPAGDVVVVALDPTLLDTLTGFLTPHQWLVGALSNGGELVTLSLGSGAEIDRVDYGDQNSPPWPAEPDGSGPSLEQIHYSLDNELPLAWKASSGANGTPGTANSTFDPGPIVIAESPARGSFIGAGLTEISVTFHEEVTGVSAGDLIVDGNSASSLLGSGVGPYVFTVPSPASDQVIVTLNSGSIQDLSLNAFSGDSWQYLLALPDVVVNEIHFHPSAASVGPTEDPERLQFIELYNDGLTPIDLTGWRFTDGVSFDFPAGSSIAAGEYLLVAKDAAFLSTTILTIPGGTQIFDWDGGNLANSGELLQFTDPFGNTIDSVEYTDEGTWPAAADGSGPSLELINANLLNEYALSWEASAASDGTPGQQNSVFNINPAPVIAEVRHDPPIPAGGTPVTITARGFDASPFPVGVQVCSRQDQSPTVGYSCVSMNDDGASGDGAAGDGVFGAVLAGLADGQRLDFSVAASGGGGLTVSPREQDCGLIPGSADCAGSSPSRTYLVKFSDAGVPTDFPSYHLITTQVTRDAQNSHTKNEYDGTVLHCQVSGICEIYYNVDERYRGQSSLNQHPHSYNIHFPDRLIQSEMGFELDNLLLMGQQPYRQMLGFQLFEAAGHPTPLRQFVRLVRSPAPHEGLESYVYINIERIDKEFMDSQGGAVTPERFPDRCSISNTVCETSLECPGGESCIGTTGGNTYRGRNDGDLRWEGPGPPSPHPGAYALGSNDRNGYQKVTNEAADDWTDLIDLADALTCANDSGSICVESGYDGSYEAEVLARMDVAQAGAWFGLQMVLNNREGGIWRDTGDDYFITFHPDYTNARMLVWDMDAIFANTDSGVNATLWRTNVPSMQRFLRHDAFAGYFVGEACRLLNDGFTQAEMDTLIDAIPDVLFTQPEPVSPQGGGPTDKAGLKNWVAGRHTGILNQISTQTTLTGIPASPYTDVNPVIALSGSLNQCGARRVRVNGIDADSYSIANVGGSGADWASNYTLVPGVNNIVVQTLDHNGAVIDSVADSVIYSPPGTGSNAPAAITVTGPTRMVNTKTYTVRAEVLDGLGDTYWQMWTETGSVTARRVSDLSNVPITVTVFETFNGGEGAGGPAPGEIRLYNGLGSVSFTIDDPASVSDQALEVTVSVGGFTDSTVVTALDATAPGLFTALSGTLSGGDLNWDPSDGVIHLTGTVTVPGGSTLNIAPGTLIMADQGSSGNGVNINVSSNASVQAIGIEFDPIFFFATNGPTAMALPQNSQNNPPSWQGIAHTGSMTSNYQHVFLTGAGNGDVTGHPRPVILGFTGSASGNISDCVFADNPGKVLHGNSNGTYVIQRSLFSRAGIGGEFFGGGHDLLIEDCWFTRNGRAPEPNGVDGDALHLDTASSTQLMRRSIIADCGDDAIDHNASFPVIEDSIIWDVRDKSASLTGGGITYDNVLSFNTGTGIRGGTGTVIVRNSTITGGSPLTGGGSVTVDESVFTSGFSTGSCSGNVNYTLGPNTNHIACGVGNISGNPLFQDPGTCDYSPQEASPATDAGPGGTRIGWLGFPEGVICNDAADCDDGNACTQDSCDTGACSFVPIAGCTPCIDAGDCNDSDPCTVDSCNAGVCSNPPGNDGGSCDDGIACTDSDICGSGICAGTENCPAGTSCDMSGVCVAGPVSLVFQDDDATYSGTEDAFIREAAPATTHGTPLDTCDSGGAVPCDFFEWDGEDPAPSQNVGMIKFADIVGPGPGAVPQGTIITAATLTLVISDPAGAPATMHPLLVDWDEATVTWNNFGGDAGPQPDEYAAQVASAPTAVGTQVIDITSTVQGWVNAPATNFGLLFLPTSIDGAQARASEYSVIAERPILTIEFGATVCGADIDCADGVFCNGVETCDIGSGACQAGAPPCTDIISCTVDSCDEGLQSCGHAPSDALCDDSNACTDDSCDAVLDCQNVNNTDPCEDGDLCTENDVCSAGVCSAGGAVDCDDSAGCTDDSCDPGIGCINADNCPVGENCNVVADSCEQQIGPAAGDVIISGFNPTDPPEWIELFNTTSQPISLADLNLISRVDTDPGDGTLNVDWQLSDLALDLSGETIAPYSFYLVGETATSPAADLDAGADGLDLATGEGGTAERAISLQVTLEAVPVHTDYVIYGRHDGSNTAAVPPGDLPFDGSTFPRAEVTRTILGGLRFNEGVLQRLSEDDLHAGHDVEGYYTDEDTQGDGFPNGVWTSSLHPASTLTPRNAGSPAVPPGGTACTADAQCDDLQFCNGTETCDIGGTDLCVSGTPPNCDDGVTCTVDSCDETGDVCENSLCPMDVAGVGGRYLAVTPPGGLSSVALRVDSVGISCLPKYVDENGFLVAAPVFQTSAEWGTVFVGDREILPTETYDVTAEVPGPQDVAQESADTWLWGDANNIDGAELFDILCVQDGFAAIFISCTLEADDVRAGIPDRSIDVDDLMAVLDGVALLPYPDSDPCSGPPPAPAQVATPTRPDTANDPQGNQSLNDGSSGATGPDTRNLITLVPSVTTVEAGQSVEIDVFVQETAFLRGYQVALEVLDSSEGLMLTQAAEITSARQDFVFGELNSFRVIDLQGARLGAALADGGIESYEPVYLGTFTFEATATARGAFVIRLVEAATFLRDDFSNPIPAQLGESIEIEVIPPSAPAGGPADDDQSIFSRPRLGGNRP